MIDPKKFSHQTSAYERPNNKYICGRGSNWGTPCLSGPNFDGTCGGAEEGQSPCTPRRSLRRLRGRYSAIIFGLIAALLIVFNGLPNGSVPALSALNPGPLTGDHLNFVGPSSKSCSACHAPHESSGWYWLSSAFVDNDMTSKCLDCHIFEGPARLAHNQTISATQSVMRTDCVMCHTEHKGSDADISALSDEQCSICHENKFDAFDSGHPQFRERFPYFIRPSIKFDHVSHIGKHFFSDKYLSSISDSKLSKHSPLIPESCITCHDEPNADRRVTPLGYDIGCKGCHDQQIAARELVVLNLPELLERTAEDDELIEACGPTIEYIEAVISEENLVEDEYESISGDELDVISSFIFGYNSDDIDNYDQLFRDFLSSIITSRSFQISEFTNERIGNQQSKKLFSGLNPEVVKRLACAWASNIEYELPFDEPSYGGWYGDFTELKYKPTRHADPVLRNWIEFSINAYSNAVGDEEKERARIMRESLLSPKNGPGACLKCHSVYQVDEVLAVNWNYEQTREEVGPHQRYSHSSHPLVEARRKQAHDEEIGPISVENSKPGCATCHQMNTESDFRGSFDRSLREYEASDPSSYASNFLGITKETCTSCHARSRVAQNCQLCHQYHIEPNYKIEMVLEKPKWPLENNGMSPSN